MGNEILRYVISFHREFIIFSPVYIVTVESLQQVSSDEKWIFTFVNFIVKILESRK